MISLSNKNLGIALAIGYVLLQPFMLQNPLKPLLSNGLGSLQVVDSLAPLISLWLIWWVYVKVTTGQLYAVLFKSVHLPLLLICLVISFLIGGIGTDFIFRFYDAAKFGYLVMLMAFFTLAVRSHSAVVLVFRVFIFVSIFIISVSLIFYLFALVYGYSSSIAQIREGFPYLGRVVRLNGPMQPTSKILGMYLLMLSLLIMLGKSLIKQNIWRITVVLSVLASMLTLGRVGAVAAISMVLGVICYSPNRSTWIAALTVPLILIGLIIQALTVWHVDFGSAFANCQAKYLIEHQTQYFGWYGKPTMCSWYLDGSVTYSSYFLMKLVAFKAWLSQPIFGIGIYQYAQAWNSVAGIDIPKYFEAYAFNMAQSTYLTLLAEVGLFGTIAWLSVVGFYLWRIWCAISRNVTFRYMFLLWCACFFYVLIDLDVQNFRFLYTLLPLSMALGQHVASVKYEK
jgi:hypothetical protein